MAKIHKARFKKSIVIIILSLTFILIMGEINGRKILSLIFYNFYHLKPMEYSFKKKKVLIIAPHPDDEALSTGGLIQKILAAGGDVYIIYLTNGDHNELAFLLDRKRLILTPTINKRMGNLRRMESEKGMEFLGVPLNHLYFLGFPDNGTLKIWEYHWNRSKPLEDLALDSDRVPYSDAYKPDALYKGENILNLFEEIIQKVDPDIIIEPHPYDYNNDHRAAYLFTKAALSDLSPKKDPIEFQYLTHYRHWPIPLRFMPYFYLFPPFKLTVLPWEKIELSQGEEKKKETLIHFYKSQFRPRKYYLMSFVRTNELFGKLDDVNLLNNKNWVDISNYLLGSATEKLSVKSIQIRLSSQFISVKLSFEKELSIIEGLSIFLFGVSNETGFKEMPKIIIRYRFGKKEIFIDGIKYSTEKILSKVYNDKLSISIPLKLLGNPTGFFFSIDESIIGLPFYHFPWRYIRTIDPNNKTTG